MKYVTALKLKNWGPFKGIHEVKLGPTIYAVVAHHDKDHDRSNWLGKTWFLSSILFALTGQKPESCRTEDDWITYGESEGGVTLITDDGATIERTRKLGSSTQLVFTPAGGKPSKQAQAQETIYRRMGLNSDDLLATSFIQQKAIARLILADPAPRTKIISGWFNLGPLERAEAWLREELNKLLKRSRALEVGEPPPGDLKDLKLKLEEALAGLEEVRKERTALQSDVTELVSWKRHQERAEELASIREQGKALRAEFDAMEEPDLDTLRNTHAEAVQAKNSALDREHELKQLMHGDWDGQCPLTCEACPAESEVKAFGMSMEIELNEAEIILDEADAAVTAAKKALTAAELKASERLRAETKLVQLRSKAESLLESEEFIEENGAPQDDEDMAKHLETLNDEVLEWSQSVRDFERAIAEHQSYLQRVEDSEKEAVKLADAIRTHREAVMVVGRQGAQREVAEAALGSIERGANDLLNQSGIDLTVEVQWAREGRGLAAVCDTCGAAFPSSLRVKSCEICGATRGPKLVEKLEIKPSDRSGAADDIAGLAFQLAAAAWLRAAREASWSCTCIDEPFGALDRANSRSLSNHIHALIRGNFAFEQGFLVAHDADVMSSLPAQVRIYGSDEGSVLEVV